MTAADLVRQWKGQVSDRVCEAFLRVPRERFVPPGLVHRAYDDVPLPLEKGATISQPTTVVRMLDALGVREDDIILEVGTGSGYNVALLATLAPRGHVYTIDVSQSLCQQARKNLELVGIKNVTVVHGDGLGGLFDCAPFDCVIVTAACESLPQELVRQAKRTFLAPVGVGTQELIRIRKDRGSYKEHVGAYVFVPIRSMKE